jgi:isoleucyl-tRNA synthetase
VTINAEPELLTFLREYATELAAIFIVSRVTLVDALAGDSYTAEALPGLRVQVSAAPGEKCDRCWCYSEELGQDASHPTICPKCTKAEV